VSATHACAREAGRASKARRCVHAAAVVVAFPRLDWKVWMMWVWVRTRVHASAWMTESA